MKGNLDMMILRKALNPTILIALCVVLQCFGAYREMVKWRSFSEQTLGLPTFLKSIEITGPEQTRILDLTGLLAMNQGFYNLFIVAGLVLAFVPALDDVARKTLTVFALACMAAAGLFGLATVAFSGTFLGVANPKPDNLRNIISFSFQAVPPSLALIGLWLRRLPAV